MLCAWNQAYYKMLSGEWSGEKSAQCYVHDIRHTVKCLVESGVERSLLSVMCMTSGIL